MAVAPQQNQGQNQSQNTSGINYSGGDAGLTNNQNGTGVAGYAVPSTNDPQRNQVSSGIAETQIGIPQEQQGFNLAAQSAQNANQGVNIAQLANNYLQKLYGMSPEQLRAQSAGDSGASSMQAGQIAGQQAGLASNAAAGSAADLARSQGLNAGQAGIAGGQTVSNTYANTFNPAFSNVYNQNLAQIQQNRNNQLAAANQSGQLGLGQSNVALGQGQLGLGMAGAGNQILGTAAQNLGGGANLQQQNQNEINQGIGGVLGALGGTIGGSLLNAIGI